MKKLLITGASGFLGWHLSHRAPKQWEVYGTYLHHPAGMGKVRKMRVDLTSYQELKQVFKTVSPDAVFHTAACAIPDVCQVQPAETRVINVDAAAYIAGLCSDEKIPCVFTSSDLVFNGLNPPYAESDTPSPANVYGEQKAQAEMEMKKRYPHTAICRMSLMYGEPAPASCSFLQVMVQSMQSEKGAFLFTDEFRTPLSATDAVAGLFLALKKQPDILHLGGPERMSRYDTGNRVADLLGITDPAITPCRRQDLDLPAPRPPDVSMDITKAMTLGFHPHGLIEYLKAMQFAT
jgi:dTDP-4-dehydrorhamnose reductase